MLKMVIKTSANWSAQIPFLWLNLDQQLSSPRFCTRLIAPGVSPSRWVMVQVHRHLCVSWSRQRTGSGCPVESCPVRFLDSLPHAPDVVPVKLFLDAAMVFALGCLDSILQGLVRLLISWLVSWLEGIGLSSVHTLLLSHSFWFGDTLTIFIMVPLLVQKLMYVSTADAWPSRSVPCANIHYMSNTLHHQILFVWTAVKASDYSIGTPAVVYKVTQASSVFLTWHIEASVCPEGSLTCQCYRRVIGTWQETDLDMPVCKG